MEIRNIILELGTDKEGDTFCKEIKNNMVEVESSWYSYKALDYIDNYKNRFKDTDTVLHIAYDDEKDAVLHMKVKKQDNEFVVVYDHTGAEKELFLIRDNISIKYNNFFKNSMERGKTYIKRDITDIKSHIAALQKDIEDLVSEMEKLSKAL
jgi:hypothetical protein